MMKNLSIGEVMENFLADKIFGLDPYKRFGVWATFRNSEIVRCILGHNGVCVVFLFCVHNL